MITVLTGVNNFGLQLAVQRQIDAFVAEHGDLALERLDGEEVSIQRMQEALSSPPFLASKKMVLLRSPGANKQFAEQAEALLNGLPETTDVILVESKLDKRSSYYKFLKRQASFLEFNELDAQKLALWLTKQASAQNGKLSSNDARYLVERVGLHQELLAHELDKLLLADLQITRELINVLTEASPQSTIFELIEAAFKGDTQRSLTLYAEQRALKVEPQQIIAMLGWQLHILMVVKAAGTRSSETIAKDAKLNPFVVRKSQAIARNLSAVVLKKLIGRLLDIDQMSKRTMLDLDDALQLFVLQLAIS